MSSQQHTDRRLTVQTLLDEPALRLTLVAGKEGRDRGVGGIHISEAPDPTPWLAPHDVLLTTGMSMGDEPGQRAYVRRLADNGVAALGFGIGVNSAGPPEALKDEAGRVGLPLFEVPYEVPFRSITSYVFSSLLSSDMHRLRRSLSVQDHLLSLMVEDRGADHLVSAVSMLLNATAILYDEWGGVASLAQHRVRVRPEHTDLIWRAYTQAADEAEPRDTTRVAGYRIAFREIRTYGRVHQVLALVVPVREHVAEFMGVVLSFAQKLLALELLKTRDSRRLRRKLSGDLLDEVLSGTGDSAARETGLRDHHLDSAKPLCVAVFGTHSAGRSTPRSVPPREATQEARNALHDALEDAIAECRLPALSVLRGDVVTALLQPKAADREDAVRATMRDLLHRAGQRLGPDSVRVGVSECFTGLADVRRAASQAREAERQTRTHGAAPIVLFRDLGPSIRVLDGQTPEQLELLYASTIKPLDDHDRATGDGLVSTMRVFLDERRSMSAAANRLFIHQNTLRYRLKKIEALLGVRLSETETLVDLHLGLRARALLTEHAGEHRPT